MSIITRHDPWPVRPGFSAIYSHGVEVAADARLLFISGQIGVTPDGRLAPSFRQQCLQALSNLAAVLEGAGMRGEDLVKLTFFLTRRGDVAELVEIRKQLLPVKAAITVLVVSALAQPEFLFEVEGVAASRS